MEASLRDILYALGAADLQVLVSALNPARDILSTY